MLLKGNYQETKKYTARVWTTISNSKDNYDTYTVHVTSFQIKASFYRHPRFPAIFHGVQMLADNRGFTVYYLQSIVERIFIFEVNVLVTFHVG